MVPGARTLNLARRFTTSAIRRDGGVQAPGEVSSNVPKFMTKRLLCGLYFVELAFLHQQPLQVDGLLHPVLRQRPHAALFCRQTSAPEEVDGQIEAPVVVSILELFCTSCLKILLIPSSRPWKLFRQVLLEACVVVLKLLKSWKLAKISRKDIKRTVFLTHEYSTFCIYVPPYVFEEYLCTLEVKYCIYILLAHWHRAESQTFVLYSTV